MGSPEKNAQRNKEREDKPQAEAPQDVVALYAWANMEGGKYRDFSASRREHRAQTVRVRPASVPVEVEAAQPEVVVEQQVLGQQMVVPAEGGSPVVAEGSMTHAVEPTVQQVVAALEKPRPGPIVIPTRDVYPAVVKPAMAEVVAVTGVEAVQLEPVVQASGGQAAAAPAPVESPAANPVQQAPVFQNRPVWSYSAPVAAEIPGASRSGMGYREAAEPAAGMGYVRNAGMQGPPETRTSVSSGMQSLQQSREQVASRWYGLQNATEHGGERAVDRRRVQDRRRAEWPPVLAVFSLAGGVGKTSLVATLGRALSSNGEQVFLADTNAYGLLPFYFGAREPRPGVVRTFASEDDGVAAPVSLENFDVDTMPQDGTGFDPLLAEMTKVSRGSQRLLVDIGTANGGLMRRLTHLTPTVLVPLVPDLTSVIGLAAVEQYFRGLQVQAGHAVEPFYILNQFDSSQPLHLDVREMLREQLGDRLLPFVIRRSGAVSESLAEGMTVVDYAPGSPVAADYLNLAEWLRHTVAPAVQGYRGARWSER